MLGWALAFFIIALIAAALGFGGIAEIIFFVALVLLALSLIAGLVRGRSRP